MTLLRFAKRDAVELVRMVAVVGLWEILMLSFGAMGEGVGEPPETITKDAAPITAVDYLPSLRLEPKKSVAEIKKKKRETPSKKSNKSKR